MFATNQNGPFLSMQYQEKAKKVKSDKKNVKDQCNKVAVDKSSVVRLQDRTLQEMTDEGKQELQEVLWLLNHLWQFNY